MRKRIGLMASALLVMVSAVALVVLLGKSTATVSAQQPARPYVNPVGDEMPIWAWYCFFADTLPPDSCFEQLKEAGFNMGMQTIRTDTALMRRVLERAELHDFRMFIQSDKIGNLVYLPSTVSHLKDCKALQGYFVMDEPKVDQFEKCLEYKDSIEKYDPKAWPYVNLIAAWDNTAKAWGTPNFRDYVQKFIQVYDPSFLSVDHYPVITTGGVHISSRYYDTYEVLSEVYMKQGIPFWAFMDCTALAPMQWPDETNMRFAVFTALAYGCQGIEWWTYTLPLSNREDWKESPVMPGGRRTPIWYAMRKVNMEVRALQKIFLATEVLGVWHTGTKLPVGTTRLSAPPAPFTQLNSGEEGVLVSHLRTNGQEYMVIVNHDVMKPQRVSLRWRGRGLRRVLPDGSESTSVSRDLTLPAGGYAIYRLP